jgi:hypothetical protein
MLAVVIVIVVCGHHRYEPRPWSSAHSTPAVVIVDRCYCRFNIGCDCHRRWPWSLALSLLVVVVIGRSYCHFDSDCGRRRSRPRSRHGLGAAGHAAVIAIVVVTALLSSSWGVSSS